MPKIKRKSIRKLNKEEALEIVDFNYVLSLKNSIFSSFCKIPRVTEVKICALPLTILYNFPTRNSNFPSWKLNFRLSAVKVSITFGLLIAIQSNFAWTLAVSAALMGTRQNPLTRFNKVYGILFGLILPIKFMLSNKVRYILGEV